MYYCAQTRTDTSGNAVYEWVKQNIFDQDLIDHINDIFTPKWNELMNDLDNNLSERIGPAINLYFQNNPVPTLVATASIASDNTWIISQLGSIIINENDDLESLKTKLPGKYVILIDAPANSIKSQSIKLGVTTIQLTHSDGTGITLNELIKSEVVSVNLNLISSKATVSSGNSEEIKFNMNGNILEIRGNAYIKDGHILVLGG